MLKLFRFSFIAIALVALASAPLAAQTKVYSNLPVGPTPPHPPNVVSEGFEADGDKELGDVVSIISGSWILSSFNVTVSNWAYCSEWQSLCAANPVGYVQPMTVTLYSVDAGDNITGVLYTLTESEFIPWRAAPNPTMCGSLPDYSTFQEWYGPDNACHGGEAFTQYFDASASNLLLPSTFLMSVSFNTQDAGYSPTGISGPDNSLNIGLCVQPCTASFGTDDNTTFLATNYANEGPSAFGNDEAFPQGDAGYSPLFEVDAIQQAPGTVTPEPATMGLMAMGLVGMGGATLRRRRSKQT